MTSLLSATTSPDPTDPASIVVWCGAGISAAAPTLLPLGIPLTNQALDELCITGTKDTLAEVANVLGLIDPDGNPIPPRLEVVLGAAIAEAPKAVFSELAPVVSAVPNAVHQRIAGVVRAGGRVLTLNFDTCIEQVLVGRPAGEVPEVVHVHGAMRTMADLEALGAFFHVIERGLPQAMAGLVDRTLEAADEVWIVGYSASDFFDVRPHIESLAARGVDLSGVRVVWLVHDSKPPVELDAYASWFRDAGAVFEVLDGWTDALLDQLMDRHGIASAALASPSIPPPPVAPAAEATDEERGRVTARLYRALGYTKGLAQLIDTGAVPSTDEDLGRIAWAEGRYSDSRRAYRRVPVTDRASSMHRIERTGACLWVQGRLIPAAAVLWRNRQVAAECLESLDPDEQREGVNWLDTFVRVLEHMDKTELRLLPKASVRRRLLAMAPTDLGVLPFDLRARLAEAVCWLDGGSGSAAAQAAAHAAREGMREAASFSGNLNYQHRELRVRPAAERKAQDYVDLRTRMTEIGAHGDAARVILIPGAAGVLDLGDAIASVALVQFGPWQRLRILGTFSLRRAAARVALRRRSRPA
jgi:hypothetical protein